MAWYFQPMPHDTHDWDATETAVLIDGEINGRPRKLLAQASRNGHFFVLDRATGKALLSTEFVKTNWTLGLDEKGQPMPNPGEDAAERRRARLAEQRRRRQLAAAELQPADRTVLRERRRARSACSTSTIRDDNPQGWGGTDRGGWSESMTAGHRLPDRQGHAGRIRGKAARAAGLLSTAGNLVFTGGSSNDLVALERDDRRRALARRA